MDRREIMSKPKITSITYSEELPDESVFFLYRLIEKAVINTLPNDPKLIGLFLQNSQNEFNEKQEVVSDAKKH